MVKLLQIPEGCEAGIPSTSDESDDEMSMSAKKKSKSRKKKGPKDAEIDFLKKLSGGSSDSLSDNSSAKSNSDRSDSTDGEASARRYNSDELMDGNNSSDNSIAERLIFLSWLIKFVVRILFVYQLWHRLSFIDYDFALTCNGQFCCLRLDFVRFLELCTPSNRF